MKDDKKKELLHKLYQKDFRRRLHNKMVEASIFGNEDEYLCRMVLPTEEHTKIDKVTKTTRPKAYVPYLATLIKTMTSFFMATATDFIVDEVLEALEVEHPNER